MACWRKLFGRQLHYPLLPLMHVRDRVASDSDYVQDMTIKEFLWYMDAKTGQHHFADAPLSKCVTDWNAALDAMGYPKNVNHSDLND